MRGYLEDQAGARKSADPVVEKPKAKKKAAPKKKAAAKKGKK